MRRSICRSMSPNTNFIAQNIQFFFVSVEYLEKMHQCHTFNVLFLFQKCVGNALVCSSFQALYKGTLNIPLEIKHHTWMLCRISFAVENNCIVLISVSIHSFVRYLTICLKQTATTIRRNFLELRLFLSHFFSIFLILKWTFFLHINLFAFRNYSQNIPMNLTEIKESNRIKEKIHEIASAVALLLLLLSLMKIACWICFVTVCFFLSMKRRREINVALKKEPGITHPRQKIKARGIKEFHFKW